MENVKVVADSGLLNMHSFETNGKLLFIYGDPTYPLGVHLQAGFRASNLCAPQKDWNMFMSQVRVTIEWFLLSS